jgi:hypothetical protein
MSESVPSGLQSCLTSHTRCEGCPL